MNDDDRRELEQYRQWMDMEVYVDDDGGLTCNFTGCACTGTDGDLGLPSRGTTLRNVAARIMAHRVDYLFAATRTEGKVES